MNRKAPDREAAHPGDTISRNTIFAFASQMTTAFFTAVLTVYLVRALGPSGFGTFALALGTGETIAGLVATLPMLFGATLQLITPWCLQNVRSYKRWVVACVSLQAAALLSMPHALRVLPADRRLPPQTHERAA